MSDNNTKTAAATGFPTLSILGIAFIVLKLTDQIDWAWKWVLSPFWLPFAFFLFVWAVIALVVAIATAGRKD